MLLAINFNRIRTNVVSMKNRQCDAKFQFYLNDAIINSAAQLLHTVLNPFHFLAAANSHYQCLSEQATTTIGNIGK